MDAFERAEQQLYEAYERGNLTQEELQRELRELARDYRNQTIEAARDAFDREMEKWKPPSPTAKPQPEE